MECLHRLFNRRIRVERMDDEQDQYSQYPGAPGSHRSTTTGACATARRRSGRHSSRSRPWSPARAGRAAPWTATLSQRRARFLRVNTSSLYRKTLCQVQDIASARVSIQPRPVPTGFHWLEPIVIVPKQSWLTFRPVLPKPTTSTISILFRASQDSAQMPSASDSARSH